ncbi:MAG: YidC/Oxa1 family membrane protein insertase [Chloroflexi bacterium]|nr:YidC/Oxa1 family membrane protein insertase [Chloroflexota bacterium]
MWDAFVNLMLNGMVLLYQLLGNNFILALVVFTVIIRLLMLPMNLRQQRSSLRMQEMQPQIQAIQKKYRDNPQKMQEEFQKVGYNPTEPLMGCLPLLLQMPIFFALFRVINLMLDSTPQSLLSMTERVYASIDLTNLLPISNTFLWMNLALPDPLLIMPVLVAGSMFIQQKLLMPPPKPDDGKKKAGAEENPMAQMNQSMLYTMPIMFGFFAMSFNAGLAIYFIVSNIIGVVQGLIVRRSMAEVRLESEARREERAKAAAVFLEETAELAETSDDGESDDFPNAPSGKKNKKKKKSNK